MILPWMLYATLIAVLFGLAAASLERVVRHRGWPVRWIWLAALLGTVALPTLAPFVLPNTSAVSPTIAATATSAATEGTPATALWILRMDVIAASVGSSFNLDPWLLGLWGIASGAFIAYLALSYRRLLRRRGGWVLRHMRGRDVWVSPDTGPAVIGFLRSAIVMPQWIFERPLEDQKLVLLHETEHVRAGDARLLLGPLIALAAAPWNVGFWWQWKRLRQAIEIDCDLRVLALSRNPSSYSRLLIDVAEQGNVHHWVLAGLSESPSFLKRRIQLMSPSSPRYWLLRAAGSSLLSIVLVFAACRAEIPSGEDRMDEHASKAIEPSGNDIDLVVLGSGRYKFDEQAAVIQTQDLERALRQRAAAVGSGTPTINVIVLDPRAEGRGYDAIMAMNAAARAGFTTARAIPDSTQDRSAEARARWAALPTVDLTQTLEELSRPQQPDTAIVQ